MIPPAIITAWGQTRPWPTREQVEQDLLLARTMVEIYNHPVLRNELVFRGGTCLHQVHLPNPLRYSEDLDFVRRTHSPIGPTLDALREVASSIGLATRSTQVGKYPRITLQASSAHAAPLWDSASPRRSGQRGRSGQPDPISI